MNGLQIGKLYSAEIVFNIWVLQVGPVRASCGKYEQFIWRGEETTPDVLIILRNQLNKLSCNVL